MNFLKNRLVLAVFLSEINEQTFEKVLEMVSWNRL